MSLSASPDRRRAAALGILALLIAALWLGPVTAYVNLVIGAADEIAAQAAILQRYRALVDKPVPAPVPAGSASATMLLAEIPEAQAVALLQERVKNAAAANRVQIHSVQVLRSDNLPSATKIGIRISAAGDVTALARLLYAIEAERPLLYPDNLQIHARPGLAGKAGDIVDLQLDVSGFVTRGVSS